MQWISAYRYGDSVQYAVNPNSGTEGRTGHITVTSTPDVADPNSVGTATQTFSVTQDGCALTIDSLGVHFPAIGNAAGFVRSGTFEVNPGLGFTGCPWELAGSDVPWITAYTYSGSVVYTVKANSSMEARTGHVTVTSTPDPADPDSVGVTSQTFTVTQDGCTDFCP